jgi:glucose-6-phosphate isomerase
MGDDQGICTERKMKPVDTGLELSVNAAGMDFQYSAGVTGPKPELRTLSAIRASLLDPQCSGPSPVYSIAMDVHRDEDKNDLDKRYLLFGVVVFAAGQLGKEPVRSQGHVHAIAPHSGWSPPELFEIWEGRAIVYAQQHTTDDPGRCVAVSAGPGEKIVVPPGWAHAVINADNTQPMVFGAWCDRQYGFEYSGVREHGGLAFFPLVRADGTIEWQANDRYRAARLEQRTSRSYPELDLDPVTPIYTQYRRNPRSVEWVAQPSYFGELWPEFEP